jgi:hypothetical protein
MSKIFLIVLSIVFLYGTVFAEQNTNDPQFSRNQFQTQGGPHINDPCELNYDKMTDVSISDLRIIPETSGLIVYTLNIKNTGPKCIKSLKLRVLLDGAPLVDEEITAAFWCDGRTWLLKANETITWQGTARKQNKNDSVLEVTLIDLNDNNNFNNKKSFHFTWP